MGLTMNANSNKEDETLPLGVFLVKSDSKEEKLLFRFPYAIDEKKECVKRSSNKYAIVINEDTNREESNSMAKCSVMPSYTELTSSSVSTASAMLTNESIATLIGITDHSLSNLFAVNSKLCGQKFELKVNSVRFVGHPMLLSSDGLNKDLLTFNVVFALRANASHDIVNCYHELSQRIAIALQFEENRCAYLSAETKLMMSAHDEVSAMADDSDDSPYKSILEKSRLAKDLKRIYESLFTFGTVHVRLNRWVEVSFCLPQKVHRLMLKTHNTLPSISPKNIQNCLQSLRPYHAILLLVETQELLDCLPQDASPAFVRVIRMANPIKNLLELSADADITLSQVFHIVAQLVYWAKATIIYPLCESNVYTIHPLAPTNVDSPLVEQFEERFSGGESLLKNLSKFSLSISLSQLRNPMDTPHQQVEQIQMIVWMLKHRLLLQLHTYIYLVPLSQATPYLTQKVSQSFSERPQSSLTTIDGDGIEFSTGSSFPSEDSLATSPANVTSILHSSKSTSEDDLSSPKVDSYLSAESGSALLKDIGLSQNEIESILRVTASKNLEDLKFFTRLCPYFNGRHHLEDIMYYENARRGQLLSLLDKFRDVLFTCQYEDASVSELCPYNQIL